MTDRSFLWFWEPPPDSVRLARLLREIAAAQNRYARTVNDAEQQFNRELEPLMREHARLTQRLQVATAPAAAPREE